MFRLLPLVSLALLLSACAAPPSIEPARDYAVPEAPPTPEAQGQLPLPPVGYCVEYTGGGNCSPDDATARALCMRQYGQAFSTAMECWQSNEAVGWGCVPLCGVSITCTGAEIPSALWCCPW